MEYLSEEWCEQYYAALEVCGNRYLPMAIEHEEFSGFTHSDVCVSPFIREFLKGVEDRLPLMKLNRWLGYIQGVLIEWSATDVTIERDFTRPYFRPLDFMLATSKKIGVVAGNG